MTWFDDFKSDEGGEPTDGIHTARLDDTAVLDTRNGPKIKLTWQTTDYAYWWESWHGIEGRAKGFTKDILRGLEIDLKALGSADDLAAALEAKQGVIYEVGVTRNGDWLNTTVEGRGDAERLDVPIDSAGLPTNGHRSSEPAGVAVVSDDDIPF